MSGAGGGDLAGYTLALGDDALVLSQRCAEWVTNAPELEEDVALANLGLDLLGQARMLLELAGQPIGRTADDLAYLRDPPEFRNAVLCELENGDFAVTMARLLAFSTYQGALYGALSRSSDPTLAGIAAKAVKEVAYHRRHARAWVVRLGDGTAESTRRMQAGVERVWPYLGELFDDGWLDPALVASGVAPWPSSARDSVLTTLAGDLAEAGVRLPAGAAAPTAGRHGRHGPELAALLAELQQVARAHPGATW